MDCANSSLTLSPPRVHVFCSTYCLGWGFIEKTGLLLFGTFLVPNQINGRRFLSWTDFEELVASHAL